MQKGNIIVVSAPSGAGKTTIVQRIKDEVENLVFSISHTTRPPRPGETGGRDYFFITRDQFRQMAGQGQFLEWAEVHGHFYGTSRDFVEQQVAAGFDVLLDIDIQGARQVKTHLPAAILVFLLPPSYAILEERLRNRQSDTEEVIQRRLGKARDEINHFIHYDYGVINDRLDHAVEMVRSIILAGRCRTGNIQEHIFKILNTFGERNHASTSP